MADPANPPAGQPSAEGPAARTATEIWIRRIAVGLVVAVVVVITFQLLAAYLPRTWAQRVGRQVDGQMSTGILTGLFYGFVFSFLAVVVVWQARRPKIAWAWKPVVVLAGLAVAFPNWLTLWVVLGTSKSAHAGERIMDVDAPGFRWATMLGSVAGVLVAAAILGTFAASRRRKRQVAELKQQVAERDARDTHDREEGSDA